MIEGAEPIYSANFRKPQISPILTGKVPHRSMSTHGFEKSHFFFSQVAVHDRGVKMLIE